MLWYSITSAWQFRRQPIFVQNGRKNIRHCGSVQEKQRTWPHDPLTGHLAQDETLHLLEPVDPAALKPDAGASYHHVCFDRLQRYKVIKQADVLLLMTRFPQLFTEEEKRRRGMISSQFVSMIPH